MGRSADGGSIPSSSTNNVIILALPRSGSSMITSIFRKHGLNIGSKGHENEFGYQTYENIKIRQMVNNICHVTGTPPVKKFKSGVNDGHIKRIFSMHMKEPWLYKVGPQDHDVLKSLDAKFVVVSRDLDSVTDSQIEKRGGNWELKRQANSIIMDYMLSFGYPVVNSDEVIGGDYLSLESAFHYCGLELDQRKVEECIDRKMWHH